MCWREDRHECNHSLGLSYNITAVYLIRRTTFQFSRARLRCKERSWRCIGARPHASRQNSANLACFFTRCPRVTARTEVDVHTQMFTHLSHTSVIRPGRIPASLWAFANPDHYKLSLLHATITTPPSSHRTHCCRSLRIPHAYMYFQPIRHVLESGDKARKAPSPALHHALLLLCFTQFRPRRR